LQIATARELVLLFSRLGSVWAAKLPILVEIGKGALAISAHGHQAAAAAAMTSSEATPKDLQIDEKWDNFIDLTLRRVVYGTLAGSLAAAAVFSK
jgi:hypothetical protein